ncbi:MAG: DUF4175 family protein [Pelobium sp.]
MDGKQWLIALQKKWVTLSVITLCLLSISIALPLTAVVIYLKHWGFFQVFCSAFLPIFLLFLAFNKAIRIKLTDLAIFINQYFPEVEESTNLVLIPIEKLNFLQRLQAKKVGEVLYQLPTPPQAQQKLIKAGVVLLLALLVTFGIRYLPLINNHAVSDLAQVAQETKIKDVIPAEISKVDVQIIAPSYTRLSIVNQKQFSLKVVEGAKVIWDINTNVAAKSIQFVFNEKETVELKVENEAKTKWGFNRQFKQSGFYQVIIDGKKSELYQIEVIEDLPVNIKIAKPAQQTVIDFGQARKVNLQVLLNDDYGITETFINATTASGKGESVSFKERKINFNDDISGRSLQLNKVLDLNALGMQPGDELYFFVKAKDNHGQESRSDIYIVSIADTAELMSMNGMLGGVNLVPEYFRSQRQIIIDTEKLLKEQPTISVEEFKNRSNNLGIDQKLLRLRYGKFLGEESETTIGEVPEGAEHAEGDGHDHAPAKMGEEKKFGDVSDIMKEYGHAHDNAEDATFFEPELKAKLKATLTEMWNSELRLRTYQPQEALPFEYKALRLLKDLQQSSRAYVAKTTIKTAPLKLEKRLTGELDKILETSIKEKEIVNNDQLIALQNSIAALEKLKQGKTLTIADQKFFGKARIALAQAASKNPSTYLNGLKLMTAIIEGNSRKLKDIEIAENALQKLMDNSPLLPVAAKESLSSDLGKAYFYNLKSKQ